MAQVALRPAPPTEVLVEFLHGLQLTVSPHDRIVPVLRGSLLMKHWFGDAARPAADIDLEWFPQPDWRSRFASPFEHARGLIMYAAGDYRGAPIEFNDDSPMPSDGVSLWDYGTPGVRCYTCWAWPDRSLRGLLQIDIAQSGAYDVAGVAPEMVSLPREWGEPVRILGYSPEMLLAAKLSWIVRHIQSNSAPDGRDVLEFRGEPKDLFDAHLLLTTGRLRPKVFQNAMLAVAFEDKLDWRQFDVLFDRGLALPENDHIANWTDVYDQVGQPFRTSSAQMLRAVIERLRPLMGDVWEHVPFLHSIQTDPVDEASLQIYADWLEEHSDERADFLRLYCQFFFYDSQRVRVPLKSSLGDQHVAWLYYVFGSPERARAIRTRIEIT